LKSPDGNYKNASRSGFELQIADREMKEFPNREGLGPRHEILLPGGRITDRVVQVGNTVRRPKKDASPIVRSLLDHLERKGFGAVPRYLGTDEQRRDILTYIPGRVPRKWQFYPDETIRLAGDF
jgi:hypothetical protein